MDRAALSFFSVNATCAAWLYRPPNADGDVPCVVMAHGFSLTRHDGLEQFAAAVVGAGCAALVYDHRFLGDSDGERRQRVRLSELLEDRRSAIAYARTIDGIDPDAVVVWGYSMSAGSAVQAAAEDHRIAAAILVCPLLDGRWASWRGMRRDPKNVAWLFRQAVKDTFGYALVPATGEPGQHGLLTNRGEAEGFRAILGPGSPWRNEVRARPTMGYSSYRPVTKARKVKCPVLIQSGASDITVSAPAIDRFARLAPHAIVKQYDIDHFGAFHGEHSARVAADQKEWLAGLKL